MIAQKAAGARRPPHLIGEVLLALFAPTSVQPWRVVWTTSVWV
jgi:hypothetical protein